MDNLERQAVILHLIALMRQRGSWCGETHVQKTLFFLETFQQRPLNLHFLLYKHGPYSFELADELTAMRAHGFLDWDIPHPNYGPRLKATQFGETVLTNYKAEFERLQPAVEFIVSKLADYGVAPLERLATALYFSLHEKIQDTSERARKIHEIKPHISEALALDAIRIVEGILKEQASINPAPALQD
jgi:uncharacterized protein YwgA